MSATLDQFLEESEEYRKFLNYAIGANDRNTRLEICKKYLEKYEPTALYQMVPTEGWKLLNVDKQATPAIPLLLRVKTMYHGTIDYSNSEVNYRDMARKDTLTKLVKELDSSGLVQYDIERNEAKEATVITGTLRVHPNV